MTEKFVVVGGWCVGGSVVGGCVNQCDLLKTYLINYNFVHKDTIGWMGSYSTLDGSK